MTNETLIDSINRYAVANAASDDAFKGLRDTACDVYQNFHPMDRDREFRNICLGAETEFMDINYGSEPAARHTNGKMAGTYKYRTYLPKAYSSAKTELAKAIADGIDPMDKGKSELAKMRKANAISSTSSLEKAQKHLKNLVGAMGELPVGSTEYDIIVAGIKDEFGHFI